MKKVLISLVACATMATAACKVYKVEQVGPNLTLIDSCNIKTYITIDQIASMEHRRGSKIIHYYNATPSLYNRKEFDNEESYDKVLRIWRRFKQHQYPDFKNIITNQTKS